MKMSMLELSISLAFERARIYRSAGIDQFVREVCIADRFVLRDRIGEGSFGTVFLAHDTELDREVAVKVMPLDDPEVAEREGKMLAALEHPNVVRIYDHGARDDYRWLVLELLDGPTLRQWAMDQDPATVVARYLEAGEGLDAAHRRGLVHRDFKADNVRLNHAGSAVVLDFGLARHGESLAGDEPSSLGDGRSTVVCGTVAYLAPECLRGRAGTERGDQFAFCVSLWEALSGENPFGPVRPEELDTDFERAMVQRARAIEAGPVRGSERIPRRLRAALRRGMAALPGDRWPTMARLLEELREGGPLRRHARTYGAALACVTVTVSLLVAIAPSPGESTPTPVRDAAQGRAAGALETEEAMRAALDGLDRGDDDVVYQALVRGVSVAAAEGREAEFVGVAVHVASSLEASARPSAREVALLGWHIALLFAQEVDDGALEARAQAGIEGQMRPGGAPRPAPRPVGLAAGERR
ncbi:serine/threonine kinase family protein [Plesiocystis pacifica SIR-1]|uniref:Serine/threonine kinase family protein n=2 Tax=Plesiocystis pacifica TaxID=191768 RepID=A6FY76_9BACT|nr:serine/threonine kinase family protein [Plesiocystis pacifica SIR-1]